MNDHIPDPTKMISDTPISDSTPHNIAELGMLCRKLERDGIDGIDRIKRLISERDTARLQADQKVSLREEFRELLGTDDIEQGIAVVCDWKQLAAVRLAYIKQLEKDSERLAWLLKTGLAWRDCYDDHWVEGEWLYLSQNAIATIDKAKEAKP
jgi:hypothetical protein